MFDDAIATTHSGTRPAPLLKPRPPWSSTERSGEHGLSRKLNSPRAQHSTALHSRCASRVEDRSARKGYKKTKQIELFVISVDSGATPDSDTRQLFFLLPTVSSTWFTHVRTAEVFPTVDSGATPDSDTRQLFFLLPTVSNSGSFSNGAWITFLSPPLCTMPSVPPIAATSF
jgi:hypothetical protein